MPGYFKGDVSQYLTWAEVVSRFDVLFNVVGD